MTVNLTQEILQLKLFDTKVAISLSDRPTEVYIQRMHIEGNSILSSVFVESLDPGASVLVEYYDYGVGQDVGENHFLGAHNLINTAMTDDRALITRVHNKPYIKCTVTGGNVKFGVYITVVSSFASDLDAALKTHGQIANLLVDKGLVAMGYDSAQNKFFFLPLENGALRVNSEPRGDLRKLISDDGLVTTPTASQDIIDDEVSVGETWLLRHALVVCRAYATFDILVGGSRVGSGRTGPATPNVMVSLDNQQVAAETSIKITLLETVGPVVDVEGYIVASKI